MQIPLSWLRDYVDIPLAATDLAHRLTLAGNEVERVERIGDIDPLIVTAEIVAVAPHPNADRLQLVTVDTGSGRSTVVTGAPNVQAGQKVAFAPVGATLVDGHTGERTTLKPAKLRGIESLGMVCSNKELGLGEDHDGIIELDLATPLGRPMAELHGDTILETSTTANRPDMLSLLGAAREVAAITGGSVREPAAPIRAAGEPVAATWTVDIEDPALCGRYVAMLIRGVRLGPSPDWMQQRLAAAGMRPISNVVDITNYVTLELGQPLHAFDAATIPDRAIVVRAARSGERLTTLDGVDRPLDPSMIVIADRTRPIALAGVMGGMATEVTDATVDILLESASFNNISIRQTSRALRLRSEASSRFEKGPSAELALRAAQRAAHLLQEHAGGTVAPGEVDLYPGRAEVRRLRLHQDDMLRILGITWPIDRLAMVFRGLGFGVRREDEEVLVLTPPAWRVDIALTEDLVEEAARIIGYDELPSTRPAGAIPAADPDPLAAAIEAARDALAAAGLQEIISYPLTSREALAKAGVEGEPLAILSPMTADQEALRTSLRASMLQAASDNLRTQRDGVALFEAGPVYLPRPNDLPEERQLVAGVLAGPRGRDSWHGGPAQPFDYYDGKGVLEALAARCGASLGFARSDDPFFTPGRAAELRLGGATVGVLGEVHPATCAAFELRATAIYFELRTDSLIVHGLRSYEPILRQPFVLQDVSLLVDADLDAERVRLALTQGRHVREVRLFDVYSGQGVPAGKKALGFSLRFQAAERTLTEDEASTVRVGLIERARKQFGAELRT